jgi:alpha-mannosidase
MNQKDTEIAIRRLERFYQRAIRGVLTESKPFEAIFARSIEPVAFRDRLRLNYKPIQTGEIWGHRWESAWFHLNGVIPSSWGGKTVVAQLDLGGEGLVVSPDGRSLQGITNGSVFDTEFGRDIVRLFDSCAGGEKIELWVEAASTGLFRSGVDKSLRLL